MGCHTSLCRGGSEPFHLLPLKRTPLKESPFILVHSPLLSVSFSSVSFSREHFISSQIPIAKICTYHFIPYFCSSPHRYSGINVVCFFIFWPVIIRYIRCFIFCVYDVWPKAIQAHNIIDAIIIFTVLSSFWRIDNSCVACFYKGTEWMDPFCRCQRKQNNDKTKLGHIVFVILAILIFDRIKRA